MPKKFQDKDNVLDSKFNVVKSPQDVVNEKYGRPNEPPVDDGLADVRKRQVKNISIFEIVPDRSQPRRTLPDDLRTQWDGQPAGVPALLDAWMLRDVEDPASDIYAGLRAAVVGDVHVDYDSDSLSLEESFLSIVELATDIHRDGLINPVTVAQAGDGYRLETGERRWLAYHLLHLLTGEERWAKIPARLMERVDRYRQAAENAQRADLNMVARARQWALLMMDAWEQQGRTFAAYEDSSSDHEFYAQVLGLDAPEGFGQVIMNACGVTSRAMLSHYRKVLKLPDAEWIVADEGNLSLTEIEGVLNALNTASEPTPPLSKKRHPKASFEGSILQIKRQFKTMGKGDRRLAIQQLEAVLDELRKSLG